jgi:hypothetical protein
MKPGTRREHWQRSTSANLPYHLSLRCLTKRCFTSWLTFELGRTAELEFNDGEQTPRNLREVEAETVPLLCPDGLNLPGAE